MCLSQDHGFRLRLRLGGSVDVHQLTHIELGSNIIFGYLAHGCITLIHFPEHDFMRYLDMRFLYLLFTSCISDTGMT